ncbi:MAG TPA: sigma 54-interacting transcriptional regulator [Chitinispirillaceae bacterium]|nr:sigma 54-interacting transcriptional regulator [Chitinispirillaceae bacterium]
MSASAILFDKEHNRRYALQGRIVTIGSSADCHIRIEQDGVPARAAHLLYIGGSYELHKLHGSVTLHVNKKKVVNKVILKHGDMITIENFEFLYRDNDGVDDLKNGSQKSPMSELINVIVELLRSRDNALFDSLVVSVARLMRTDAARIVVENPETAQRTTLTRYPISSGLDRFSNRAIDWAAESDGAVITHADQWRESDQSMRSLERNLVESVICAPLRDSGVVLGYLYLDRVNAADGFTQEDKEFLDALLPLLSVILSTFSEKKRQKETIERLQNATTVSGCGIIYESDIMNEVLDRAKRFARTDSPILITGETGTGKELIAKLIHEHSSRSVNAFKAINCGAIPENLIESELFGHEKGAFTGAVQRKTGLFESAEKGTVFLDEIGELPLQLQVRLLRVLQESEVTRVGGTDTIKINVRIVAATNRQLEKEIANGTFRQDLYFRLNVLTLNLPPLRDRGSDIHLLLDYFTKKYCQQFGLPLKSFSAAVRKMFLLHSWPGNIRELENAVQKAILISDQNIISPENFSIDAMGVVLKSSEDSEPVTLHEVRDRAEKTAIVNALVKTKGNVSLSSKILEIDRKWLMKKMEEFEISADRYR